MPVVTLPAADVLKAAESLLAQNSEEYGARSGFQKTVQLEMRKPQTDYDKLTKMIEAAKWLIDTMEISDAVMGLDLDEARTLEPMLPRYN